jgi:hypothetical protein
VVHILPQTQTRENGIAVVDLAVGIAAVHRLNYGAALPLRWQARPALIHGKLFFDFTSASGEDGLDCIKVDQKGNLYAALSIDNRARSTALTHHQI